MSTPTLYVNLFASPALYESDDPVIPYEQVTCLSIGPLTYFTDTYGARICVCDDGEDYPDGRDDVLWREDGLWCVKVNGRTLRFSDLTVSAESDVANHPKLGQQLSVSDLG